MSEYQPGTVAVATVQGTPNVRVMRIAGGFDVTWASEKRVGGDLNHFESEVTDVRPLVVLDLGGIDGHDVAKVLRYERDAWDVLADQIEAQTKPPRIPEPGQWGVVEAHIREDGARRWVNYGQVWRNGYGNSVSWDELIDPTLIREGVQS